MIQLKESYKSENSPLNFQCRDCHLPSFKCEDCYQLSFQCEHCDQAFNINSVNVAIFLHGVFFLVDKDVGFLGFNCPKCLNTLLLKGEIDLLNQLIPPLLKGIHIDRKTMYYQLRYFPSVNYSPKSRIPGLGAFNITTSDGFIYSGIEEMQQQLIVQTEELPELDTDYLCSYSSDKFDEELPMGPLFSVSWFKEDQVEKLADFENRKQFKVFPRYFYNNDLLDKVENFCWHNHLCSKFLSDDKKDAEENLKVIADAAEFGGHDIDNIMESNPGSGPLSWKIIQENLSNDFNWNLTGKFMEILVADPDPLPNLSEPNQLLKGLWKSRFPFKNETVPDDLKNINTAKFDRAGKDKLHHEMVGDLQKNFHLKTVQTFLKESSHQFIEDYINRAQDTTFSYADLWEIKEKYLKRLYDELLRKGQSEANFEYAFLDRGEFYEIIYEGKLYRIQKRLGIQYLHYLVQHKNEEVSLHKLDIIGGINPEQVQDGHTKKGGSQKSKSHDDKKSGKKPTVSIFKEYYGLPKEQVLEIFKKEKSELEREKEEAESFGHTDEAELIAEKLQHLTTAASEYFSKKGNPRRPRRTEDKILKDRILNPIKREINEKILDPGIKAHFSESFKSIPGKMLVAYKPIKDIEWFTG